MKLYIDTSSNLKTVVGLDEIRLEKNSSLWHSQVVLPMIQLLLVQQKTTLSDLTEIEVVVGPGSFTGLRVGVSIANTLGYVLKIPVNGKTITENQIIEPMYN